MSSYSESIGKQEIGIALSNTYEGQIAKVCIPVLTPDLETNRPYKVRVNRPSTSNIVSGNADKLDIRSYYRSNYLEIKATRKVFMQDKLYISILSAFKNMNFEMAGEYNG